MGFNVKDQQKEVHDFGEEVSNVHLSNSVGGGKERQCAALLYSEVCVAVPGSVSGEFSFKGIRVKEVEY